MKRHVGALATIAALLGPTTAIAQERDSNPLTLVKTLTCKFPVYSVASWKGGEPQAQIKLGQQLSLEVDEIDTESGTARVVGTSGPVHATALLTMSSLHFMERTVTGTLNVTTVFAPEGSVTILRAVHSKHDYFPMSFPGFVSEPIVTQSYGTCTSTK